MKKFTFAVPFIVAYTSLLLVCCKKEQTDTVSPGNPTDTTHTNNPTDTTQSTDSKAVFTFLGLECPRIIIDSIYYVGEAIDGTDSIQVKIDVSKSGSWSFNTDTINGIYFKGTGTISVTGQQYINLHVTGIPVSPGNSIFTINTDTSQVNVFVSVVERDVTTETMSADTPYFKVTIDQMEYNVRWNDNNPAKAGGAWGRTFDSISVAGGVGPGVYPLPPGSGALSIQKNYIGTDINNISESDFKHFFMPGTSPIAIKTCDRMTKGIIVFWTDANDQFWSTVYGDDQKGSYFKIVSETDGHDSIGRYFVKVKLRFKCKVYSYPTKQVKEINDGEMVAYLLKPYE